MNYGMNMMKQKKGKKMKMNPMMGVVAGATMFGVGSAVGMNVVSKMGKGVPGAAGVEGTIGSAFEIGAMAPMVGAAGMVMGETMKMGGMPKKKDKKGLKMMW